MSFSVAAVAVAAAAAERYFLHSYDDSFSAFCVIVITPALLPSLRITFLFYFNFIHVSWYL